MVRMTIACARCRRLKIKCVHGGTAPCRNCSKKGSPESGRCVLSEPELKTRTAPAPAPAPVFVSVPRKRRELDHVTREVPAAAELSPPAGPSLLHTIELSVVLAACSTFTSKFPELRFLHLPSFTQRVRSAWENGEAERRNKFRLLCAAIVAVCSPLAGPPTSAAGSTAATTATTAIPHEKLAAIVRKNTLSFALNPPDLVTVQILVVLSMYEWGMGNGYRVWMCSGMAARMMQSLLVLTKPSSLTPVEREESSRTFWSCFVMDRLVFCGRPQPFTLSMYAPPNNTDFWPAGEQDFIFGPPLPSHAADGSGSGSGSDGSNNNSNSGSGNNNSSSRHEPTQPERMHGDIDHYYGVLVRGFDIWARIFQFVVNGGRRQPDMCLPENHPWVEGSPWKRLYNELRSWRQEQDRRLCYPETAVQGHAVLGQAEPFGYVNLIFYVSMLLLGREYLPFLPTPESEPAGPVDQPLLPLQAPPQWWTERAAELFMASRRIVRLLNDLEDTNAQLQSPFAGFCSFSAATMNLYVSNFPSMNLGRSGDMTAVVATNLGFLDRFQRVWPMGRGWWVTIQHCRSLYEYASRGREMFHGRTRADFEALEYSIHDSRGQPPTEGEAISPANSAVVPPPDLRSRLREGGHGEPPAEMAIPTLPFLSSHGNGNGNSTGESAAGAPAIEEPSQIWPLWGELQTVPFALEGVPLDYNLDMLDMYP